MKQTKQSRPLLDTCDGSMKHIQIRPKYKKSTVIFKLTYYDDTKQGALTKVKLIFKKVIALSFSMNYFDTPIGAELCGFYEITDKEKKRELIEQNFRQRKEGFLCHGNYTYDPEDPDDMLNYRKTLEKTEKKLHKYHLYQQQTTGGIYYILAKSYEIKKKKAR